VALPYLLSSLFLGVSSLFLSSKLFVSLICDLTQGYCADNEFEKKLVRMKMECFINPFLFLFINVLAPLRGGALPEGRDTSELTISVMSVLGDPFSDVSVK
jgi:hypothetical protein